MGLVPIYRDCFLGFVSLNLYFCHPFKKWNREVAQAGSAPGLGPGGRRFESCLPDKRIASIFIGAFLTKKIPQSFSERWGGWVAEINGLLNRRTTLKLYRGFESLPHRNGAAISIVAFIFLKSILYGIKLFRRGGSNPSLTASNRNCCCGFLFQGKFKFLQGVLLFIVIEKAVPEGLHLVALRIGRPLGIKYPQEKTINKLIHVGRRETLRWIQCITALLHALKFLQVLISELTSK